MSRDSEFDPATRCFERLPKDIWKPYSNPEHRIERDLIYGANPKIYMKEIIESCGLCIPRDRFFNAYEAICYVNARDCSLTNFLTINWSQFGFKESKEANRAYNNFMDRFSKFAQYHNFDLLYITVFENTDDVGLHSHTLFYFPYEGRDIFKNWIYASMFRIAPIDCSNNIFDVRFDKNTNIYAQWNYFKYMFKSIDTTLNNLDRKKFPGEDIYSIYGLTPPKVRSKYIDIQPVRISRVINNKARNLFEFSPLIDIRKISPNNRDIYNDNEYKRECYRYNSGTQNPLSKLCNLELI